MVSESAEVSILFTDDNEIKKLNSKYRGKNKATDVLSFAQQEADFPKSDFVLFGDIVISFETAKRQAVVYGTRFRDEILRLLVHGVLHLLGYEHERVSRKTALEMRRKEEMLLTFLKS